MASAALRLLLVGALASVTSGWHGGLAMNSAGHTLALCIMSAREEGSQGQGIPKDLQAIGRLLSGKGKKKKRLWSIFAENDSENDAGAELEKNLLTPLPGMGFVGKALSKRAKKFSESSVTQSVELPAESEDAPKDHPQRSSGA